MEGVAEVLALLDTARFQMEQLVPNTETEWEEEDLSMALDRLDSLISHVESFLSLGYDDGSEGHWPSGGPYDAE